MSNLDEKLKPIRGQIDALDERLVALINERARLVQSVGQAKAESGLRVYAPDRERLVLDRLDRLNTGPISTQALHAIYRELMSASLVLERSPRIAVLGPAGTFSHLAGRRKFGHSVEFELLATIAAVFEAVAKGWAEYGLVPVENSTAGGVGETLDLLITRGVKVCGEVSLAIHHHLLSSVPLEQIEKVYSKPEVFSQCQKFLSDTGLLAKAIPVASSSAAAERATSEPNAAAIASELAAEVFGLNRVEELVEDEQSNVTRFLIIGSTEPKATGSDKTSIVFDTGHQPGTLVSVLEVFRAGGLNMARIESRASRVKDWSYHFFVDIEGHRDDPPVGAALKEASARCSFWKVLGSYPRMERVV